jgi:hypothetical protein
VWVDADSRVYKPLPELGPATYDVAAPASTLAPIGRVRFHVEAALIYLNHTPGARKFLSRWRTKCESLDWPVGDHCHFLSTWEELEAPGGVKLLKLPPGVCARGNCGGTSISPICQAAIAIKCGATWSVAGRPRNRRKRSSGRATRT